MENNQKYYDDKGNPVTKWVWAQKYATAEQGWIALVGEYPEGIPGRPKSETIKYYNFAKKYWPDYTVDVMIIHMLTVLFMFFKDEKHIRKWIKIRFISEHIFEPTYILNELDTYAQIRWYDAYLELKSYSIFSTHWVMPNGPRIGNIDTPTEIRLEKDLELIKQAGEWGIFLLKNGSEVLKYINYFSVIYKKLGRIPKSLRELKSELTSEYCNEKENIKLAKLCHFYKLDQAEFDKYLELLSIKKPAESCPYIHITGLDVENFNFENKEKWVFERLASDDIIGPMLGYVTDCCQHLNSTGAKCAIHGYRSSLGAFYVVRYNDKIIAQSWAWRGTKGELVFDNVEVLGTFGKDQIEALYRHAAKRLVNGPLIVTRVLVGKDDELDFHERKLSIPANFVDYFGYSDAKKQILLAQNENYKYVKGKYNVVNY